MMENHYLNCIAIGGVLRNWPHVFSILSLFSKHEPIAKTYDKLIHAFSGPNGKSVWGPLTAGRRGGRRTFALPRAFSIRRRNALRRELRTDDHHRVWLNKTIMRFVSSVILDSVIAQPIFIGRGLSSCGRMSVLDLPYLPNYVCTFLHLLTMTRSIMVKCVWHHK